VINELERQTDFKFFFSPNSIDVERGVSLTIKTENIEDALTKLFKDSKVDYKIEKNQIILTPQTNKTPQQKIKVSGIVTDSKGEILPGVSIIEKSNALNGVITGIDGTFSITVNSDATLIFSFIGFKNQEVNVSGRTSINVVLQEDVTDLDEVVIVGYGAVKKSDLTGSVSQVKSEDITAFPSLSVDQALQGRAAGVQIQSNNGEPGAGFKMRIRGATSINSSSDPLYVVDGFPGGELPPPEDIQSIEVLKDASATAIYGSRGANGVIMVTTKRGKEGKAKIAYNTSYSVQEEIARLDLLETKDFINYVNDAKPNDFYDVSDSYANTDWQDQIFRKGYIQNHQLSMSGGDENLRYYISGVVYDQTGVIKGSKYNRYSITSNLDITASDKFKAGLNLFAQRSIQDGTRTQETVGGANEAGVISTAYRMGPHLGIYNDDGSYTLADLNTIHDNPVAITNEYKRENLSDRIQGNFYGDYALYRDLNFRITLGARLNSFRNGEYHPTTLNSGESAGGIGSIDAGKNLDLINENYLSYSKKIANTHDVNVMAGYSYQSFNRESWYSESQGYLSDSFLWWDLDGGSTYNMPSSELTDSELSSFYSRINYKLADRYLLTLNARYDGSSRFAQNNKWSFFPSGALGWNVTEESFMENISQVSQLKLRGSYGITGNQAITPYQSLARLQSIVAAENNQIVNAVVPLSVANENLTWESTSQFNVGFDFGLFGQRIYLVADYYKQKTTDLLFELPLPRYSGYTTMLQNVGSLENRGIELSLTTDNLKGELKWITSLNFSTNKNKILELPDGNDIFYEVAPGHITGVDATNVLRVGEAVGAFYGYIYDGVIQEGEDVLPGNFEQNPGGQKFKDINGRDENGNLTGKPDGKIDTDDRTIIGNPHPDFIWGLNNTLEYKNIDLNLFIQGTQGNDIYSFTSMEIENMDGTTNATTKALDRWTPTNTNTDVPAANDKRNYTSSSRWVHDGSYIRLKNVAIGYKFPSSFSKKLHLSSARIYVSAQNLVTITDYPGVDPEVNYQSTGDVNSNRNLGFDYGSYPNTKSVTFGLQVNF
jgi:TonB-linked SusC/RagA family outer membrane protein